jgi:hypothetical protein
MRRNCGEKMEIILNDNLSLVQGANFIMLEADRRQIRKKK